MPRLELEVEEEAAASAKNKEEVGAYRGAALKRVMISKAKHIYKLMKVGSRSWTW